jgi:hypothetical protein
LSTWFQNNTTTKGFVNDVAARKCKVHPGNSYRFLLSLLHIRSYTTDTQTLTHAHRCDINAT